MVLAQQPDPRRVHLVHPVRLAPPKGPVQERLQPCSSRRIPQRRRPPRLPTAPKHRGPLPRPGARPVQPGCQEPLQPAATGDEEHALHQVYQGTHRADRGSTGAGLQGGQGDQAGDVCCQEGGVEERAGCCKGELKGLTGARGAFPGVGDKIVSRGLLVYCQRN